MKSTSRHLPGLTPRAILAGLFGMTLAGLIVLFFEGIEGGYVFMGGHALALPAMAILLALVLAGGVWQRLFGRRLLSRPELLCVLFMMLLSVPLMSSGFWMQMVGAIGSIPKTADFETYDALPPALWPHGPNLLADALVEPPGQGSAPATPAARVESTSRGHVEWREMPYARGRSARLPVLHNDAPDDVAWIRFKLPLAKGGAQTAASRATLVPGEPYFLAVLLRPEKLGPAASYYARVYHDEQPVLATEAFSARARGEVTYLQPEGFLRKGMYGLLIPETVQSHVYLEIGLTGSGTLAIADPQLMSVGTLDSIYRGRKLAVADADAASAAPQRTELLRRPAHLLSLAGARELLGGNTPWRDWLTPFFTWTSFAALLLLASHAVLAVLRRQWIDNERYLLPMTRIPLGLIGESGDHYRPLPTIFYSRTMWLGFGLTLFWCLMKGWRQYNTNVPDLTLSIELAPYFTDAGWGDMWRGREVRNVTFTVTALFLSVAIFMELNVLLSLVVGFFLFRAQYWFGMSTGLALKKNFPYPDQQQIGAFLMYALLVLFFTRKHWWRTLRSAWRGEASDAAGEVLSYRSAYLLLAATLLGALVWAHCTQIPVAGILVFFVALLLIALVSAKLRAECGTPMAMFSPVLLSQMIPLFGGLFLFGPQGAIFISLANWIIFKHLFFLLPGVQLEMMELGRRFHLPGRQINGTILLGCLGGLLLGGWLFLSLSYGIGGDNFGERWPFMDKSFLVNDFNVELAKANTIAAAGAWAFPYTLDATSWGAAFAAAVTTLLTILRQIYTGFWFHPIGFIVSTTPMMEKIWGSVLVAWIIRSLTLKLGGAAAVRQRLFPFFIGVFLASLTMTFLFALLNTYIYFYHPAMLPADLDF